VRRPLRRSGPSMSISREREQPHDVVATDDRPSVGASGHSSHGSGRSRAPTRLQRLKMKTTVKVPAHL
jgi:hypothetical protein